MPGSSSAVTVSSPRFDRPPPPIVLAAGVLTAILPALPTSQSSATYLPCRDAIVCPHHHPHRHRGRRGGIRCGVCRSRQGAGRRFEKTNIRERATIFTDTQTAIRRGLGGVWPGQMYAFQGSTSRCYGGPDRTSPSKSGGARRTRGSQETSLLRRCMASESILKLIIE